LLTQFSLFSFVLWRRKKGGGAAYGTSLSAFGVNVAAKKNPDMLLKAFVPVVMAGVIGIFGLIISILILGKIKEKGYSEYSGMAHLNAGLTLGLSGLAAGYATGVAGQSTMTASAYQPKLYVGAMIILAFANALSLYGLIVALMMSNQG
jgi:V-type H+-transporting ATPase 16kDa proteolipid subunit